MRTSVYLSAVSAIAAIGAMAVSTNAPVVTGNPPGAPYVAQLPDTVFDKDAFPDGHNAIGRIWAQSATGGSGVDFKVFFANLPKTGGPFLYHIHAHRVPENGNCTATGAHLDPYNRTESPACDSSAKETCQVGDLSGKYGKITSDPFTANFTDLYTSTDPANPAFFGDLSFVVHFANKTRISCANFEVLTLNATAPGKGSTSAAPSDHPAAPTATPNSLVTAGAQANRAASYGAAVVGIAAAALINRRTYRLLWAFLLYHAAACETT